MSRYEFPIAIILALTGEKELQQRVYNLLFFELCNLNKTVEWRFFDCNVLYLLAALTSSGNASPQSSIFPCSLVTAKEFCRKATVWVLLLDLTHWSRD